MKNLWLCLPFLAVLLLDVGLTLLGQPIEYWSGDRSAAKEVFPLFAWGLHHGPIGFIGVSIAWAFTFSILLLLATPFLARILSLALVNGHTWGAMTWLVYRTNANSYACLLVFIVSATLFVMCYQLSECTPTMEATAAHDRARL